ncbi:recombinase [Amycolatopsis mediterranei S699]|uniref:Recombinase n=1 Tax=Amycolatopsis mediterranei (strain S699) TaxID=713604 RepID=A0A9R0P362_AMYMS|nr:recombinase [Amycolatopsis mediterranei S699]
MSPAAGTGWPTSEDGYTTRWSLGEPRRNKQRVEDERQKLLSAHYAGAIPQDLLASEMKRLTRALAEAEGEIKAAKVVTADVEATLDRALAAASHCEIAYLSAPNHVRRQINQGFFEKLYIGQDGTVERADLTEPFAALLEMGETLRRAVPSAPADPASQITPGATNASGSADATTDRARPSDVLLATFGERVAVTECAQTNTPGEVSLVGRGVKEDYLVGMTGFEPATLRSQSGCATKLRHIPGPPPGGCAISLAGHAKLAMHPGTSGGTRV